ncbi:MAG: OmpA family protein [Chitinophagaceae bacterium]|nr:OmpA family protein [Chitinophagaceae bacterium]MBP9102789.1 OmpA family protein [Chitinophagaceae bacterium]
MKLIQLILVASSSLLFFSCVSSKKFKTAQADYTTLETKYKTLEGDMSDCSTEKATLAREKAALEREIALQKTRMKDLDDQVAFLKSNNNQAIKQLEDLSVITASQAESIKKSMENIGAKDNYIMTLQQQMAHKDSLNMALVMNLKGAIGNLDDEDINIKVDKGVVYIDISDKLLFTTGKYDVTNNAKVVLGKVAAVLKNQPDIEFMVEGHTDNVPFRGGGGLVKDNWDLSVKRATAVVRLLQNDYGLDPARMAAAGRGEYKPIADNSTKEGKAANRRTRIVILPQLDQFFQLLEPKKN